VVRRLAPEAPNKVIAAVDLGSNSFHMIIAELRHGQLEIIDRMRDTVRLGEGLSDEGELADGARNRALNCLSRFGERLQEMRVSSVRTAGTSAIRRARADSDFIAEAEAALGHSIDVISGIEEARLIYSGVTHSIPLNDGLRLVLDIGGGSTELILGQGGEPQLLESLDLGCVSITERYFEGGKISREAFEKARTAARLRISPVQALFGVTKAIESVGTSGTIRSTLKVARELDFTDAHELDVFAVDRLIERVLEFDTISELSLPGLSERRAEVWPGGLAILAELLALLHIEALSVSDGALREGLLYDLLAQLQNSGDTRSQPPAS